MAGVTGFLALTAGVCLGQATNTNSTDYWHKEFAIKPYADYQADFASITTMGFKPDPVPGPDAGPVWFDYWKDQLGAEAASLGNLRYYLRKNPVAVTDANYKSFENVQRVMRILPEHKFNEIFPLSRFELGGPMLKVTDLAGDTFSTAADTASASVYWHKQATLERAPTHAYFSYDDFLKAVALLPGFCGDYSQFPDAELRPVLQSRADLIARKLLASLFAHAVQETSNSGQPPVPNMMEKLPGTFASVMEIDGLYPDAQGLFGISIADQQISGYGPLYPMTLLPGDAKHEGRRVSHAYSGRGVKQTSYPINYANASLFLFGDLRLLAYPELIEEPGVMAFLSGLVYALQPKDSNPSIVEILDGTFHRKLEELAADPAIGQNPEFQAFKATYDQEFPLTVLMVNGGPECNGNPANKNSTKIRIAAYNYFVTTETLLNHVQVGGAAAATPAFTPLDPASTTGDQYVPADGTPARNDYYNLTGNQETCQLLMIGTVNDIFSDKAWRKMFARTLHFGPNWEGKLRLQVSAGGTLPIFGGKPVHEVMARAYPDKDTDQDNLTDKDELVTYQSDPFKASTFGDGMTDGEKQAIGLAPGTDYATAIHELRAQGVQQGIQAVLSNPVSYQLYSEANIEDINLGGLMLRTAGAGAATLSLQLQAAENLADGFSDLGEPVEVQLENLPHDKYFLRVRALGPR